MGSKRCPLPVVVLGTLALAGYVTERRALDSTIDETDIEPAIDVTVIKSAVLQSNRIQLLFASQIFIYLSRVSQALLERINGCNLPN